MNIAPWVLYIGISFKIYIRKSDYQLMACATYIKQIFPLYINLICWTFTCLEKCLSET